MAKADGLKWQPGISLTAVAPRDGLETGPEPNEAVRSVRQRLRACLDKKLGLALNGLLP
jgi:hypothetical protein